MEDIQGKYDKLLKEYNALRVENEELKDPKRSFVTCQANLSADHTSAVRGNAHFYPWSDFYFKSVKNFMPHIIKSITVSF